jgi:RNA polymerase sigma factor (sigma-70 family)
MTNGQPTNLLKHVRKLVAAQTHQDLGDAELLDLFRDQHDETAFAALMERHGAMVLGVCRRVLGNHHDAEDASQATFLVFARKSGSIRKKGALGSWLHGVAFRMASDLKKRIARGESVHDRKRKGHAKETDTEVSWREVQSILDEELARLPEIYRIPVVLCCLEGRTRDEAAQQVGWSLGSLRGRLDRGREMLRARLVRRGVTLTAAMVGAILAGNGTAAALPPTLALATCTVAMAIISGKKVATGILSAQVASLSEGMVRNMFMTKVKLAAMLLTTALLIGGATGAVLCGADDRPLAAAGPPQSPNPRGEKDKAPPASDLDRLQGTWVTVACEMNGDKVNVTDQDFKFNPSFDGDDYVVQFGPVHMKGKFKIDPKINPKSITLNDTDGTVNAGIYEFVGDQLRICIADSKSRPTAFKTQAGSGHSLILLKRLSREEPANSPKNQLPKPKVEEKKVYTPDEVMLEQEKARGKAVDGSKSSIATVQFKVQAVTKSTEIKLNTEKDSPYIVGHGPDDICLHPQPPRKFEEKQFTAILTSKIVKQLQLVGIKDVGKHFMGKTIRISGRINQHHYSGDDPPIEPHYDLIIEDVSQIETVKEKDKTLPVSDLDRLQDKWVTVVRRSIQKATQNRLR